MPSLVEIDPVVLEKKIWNFVNAFLLLVIISSWKIGAPSFAQWLWRRRFLKFVNVFLLIRNYLTLEKAESFHLNKLVSPTSKDETLSKFRKICFDIYGNVLVYNKFKNSPGCNVKLSYWKKASSLQYSDEQTDFTSALTKSSFWKFPPIRIIWGQMMNARKIELLYHDVL